MKPITNKTEFIIGIDFGHGETSACYQDLREKDEWKDLDILPGKKVIKSAVSIVQQEGEELVSVGQAAVENSSFSSEFRLAFKKRPSEMSADDRRMMAAFMRGVYQGILERNPDFSQRDHRVLIARPSNDKLWAKEEKAYVAIAEKAGLPVAGIQKESRAAFFRARTQPDSKIDNNVKKGVLIVDFGSSTVDFTYLNKRIQQPIDDGADLGASEVELTLMQYAFAHPQDDKLAMFARCYGTDPHSVAFNKMLYLFRDAKEQYYGNKLQRFALSWQYGTITSAEQKQMTGFGGIELGKADVQKALAGYIGRVEQAVRKFKDQKLKDQQVACVYLTGGASRMDFVREVFMRVFGLKDTQVPEDTDPSVIVSQGVAKLSYADWQTMEKEKNMRAEATKIINSFDWNGKITGIVRDGIKSAIKSRAHSIMSDYKNGDIYDCYRDSDSASLEILTYTNVAVAIAKIASDIYDCYRNPDSASSEIFKCRNVEALITKITSEFDGFTHIDFAAGLEKTIREDLLKAVVTKLNDTFSAFCYKPEQAEDLDLSGLSARVSRKGAESITNRFTAEGSGHVLYDAVASCYIANAMVGWDLQKDRKDSDRKQHYDYYMENYYNIFTNWDWWLQNYVSISGIDTVRQKVSEHVQKMINDYISYAKLAVLFK